MNKKIIFDILAAIIIAVLFFFIINHWQLNNNTTIQNVKDSNSITTHSNNVPNAILAEWEAYGGMCQYGGCKHKVIIYSNGDIQDTIPVYKEGKPTENKITMRKISASVVADLVYKINQEDLEMIKKSKFEGTCPIAYDGSAYLYTIYKNSEKEMLDSCKQNVDRPLFNLIDQISIGSPE